MEGEEEGEEGRGDGGQVVGRDEEEGLGMEVVREGGDEGQGPADPRGVRGGEGGGSARGPAEEGDGDVAGGGRSLIVGAGGAGEK